MGIEGKLRASGISRGIVEKADQLNGQERDQGEFLFGSKGPEVRESEP